MIFIMVILAFLVTLIFVMDTVWFKKLFCSIFGHKTNEKVFTGGEYMTISVGPIDGIGREHATLYGTCPRCRKVHRMGKIHRPIEWYDGKKKVLK